MNNNLYGLIKKPVGFFSFSIIVLAALVSTFCYFFATDHTTNANMMNVSLANKPIGYTTQIIKVPLNNDEIENGNTIIHFFFGKPVLYDEVPINSYKIEGNHIKYIPKIADQATTENTIPIEAFSRKGISIEEMKQSYIYTKKYLLGTDKYGRDFYSRLLIGTRISFSVGFIAVLISLLVGISVGALGGYYRGKTDLFVMWLINTIWSIPTLLLVIAITIALGKGYWQIFLAVGLTMWVEVARVVRGQFLSFREKEFVEAAKSLGFSDYRIITKQILPNVLAPIIVISAANFASAILIESGLSFLGIGIQPPVPSWGNIVREHYAQIIFGHQYLAILPGVLIMTLVLAFTLFGNELRDVLDVKN